MRIWSIRKAPLLSRFGKDRRGNIAITFALALVPLVGFAGAAVDYSRANQAKANLQDAVDSTALMLSKNAASLTSSALQTEASNDFKDIYTSKFSGTPSVTATYTTSGGAQVVVTATATVPTVFSGVIGVKTITINATSTVKWGSNRLRVALVLDNTGSMADANKLTTLQSATNSLLDQLSSAASQNGDVYVSIIPFAKDVDLDSSNWNANWIDWTDWNSKNCSWGGGGWGWGGGSGTNCPASTHKNWNGCVMDRGDATGPDAGNYDTNVVEPTPSKTATQYAAEQYSACPVAAMGLSYDWSAMSSLIDSMSPNGGTNQVIGLQAGWMSLTGGGPFTVPAEDKNYTYDHIVILLSDGLNTQDRWRAFGDGSTQFNGQIDARQKVLCDNMKNAGVTIYTIQVNTDHEATSSVLQYCASSSDKFYLLTAANQITATFEQIGTTSPNCGSPNKAVGGKAFIVAEDAERAVRRPPRGGPL